MMNLLLTCYDPPSIKRNWGEKKCLLVTDLARGSKTVQKPKEVMSACRFELQERGRAFSSRGAHTLSLFQPRCSAPSLFSPQHLAQKVS